MSMTATVSTWPSAAPEAPLLLTRPSLPSAVIRFGDSHVMTGNSKDYIDVDMTLVNDLKVSSVKQISATCSQQNMRYARSQAADMLAAG